jgi:hypothetical protein
MTTFVYIIIFLNSLGLLYLAYLILKKYSSSNLTNSPLTPVSNIQKIGLFRYNPFDDLGSDQSFSLSILDSTDSGVILTSLHHRNFTRIYAKPIKNGEGDSITLSKEEKSAIVKAIKH